MDRACSKCGRRLSPACFYRHPAGRDGLMSACRECHKRAVRENRKSKLSRYAEYERARAALPHRVEARRAYSRSPEGRAAALRNKKAWVARNPEKRAAHIAVGNAVRDGVLKKRPCEVCGAGAHAHHDDYTQPLAVRWLCPTHHREWHSRTEPKEGMN